jgi:CRISPR type IV-associated protein Csf3
MDMMQVRAWLRTPVISDATLPLDGILLYQAMRRRYGPQDATLSGALSAEPEPLPLARAGEGEQWYYRCSFATWSPTVAEGRGTWNKRINTRRIDVLDRGHTAKINVGGGRYRSYHMPVFYRSALWIAWYADGDMDAVRGLLRDVWAIGKKTSQGYGRVVRWEVEPWPHDWSVERDGKPMRAVPIGDTFSLDDHVLYAGYRPPYWLSANQAMCRMPEVEDEGR